VSDERLRRSYDRLLSLRAETGGDRSACPRVEAMMSVLLKEGSEEDRLVLLDHVMACPFCQSEFALLRTTLRASRTETAPEQP
jgi:hypothetical protein